MYELVYMMRMGDDQATRIYLNETRRICIPFIRDELKKRPDLSDYFDDLRQVADITAARCVDYYNEAFAKDIRAYAAKSARRRVKDFIRDVYGKQERRYGRQILLDDLASDDSRLCYYERAAKPSLLDPEYHLRFTLANERYDKLMAEFKASELAVLNTWRNGGSYEARRKSLGIETYRQYEGRLRRVRAKVYNAILDPEFGSKKA